MLHCPVWKKIPPPIQTLNAPGQFILAHIVIPGNKYDAKLNPHLKERVLSIWNERYLLRFANIGIRLHK